MLSRVADSLYWMSRYMERAENIARILDVNLQHVLDLPQREPELIRKLWTPVLRSTGDERDFYARYKEASSETVIDFLTLNQENHNSIVKCVTACRENARHVREQISDEMWEELNRFYLSLQGLTVKKILKQGADEFFKHIRSGSHLFQGITDATMTHGEGWDFIQVGKYLERIDKTTRILDSNEDVLQPKKNDNDRATDTLKLAAILRSCSAHSAYRRVYVAQIEARKVLEFLILNPNFPRSIRFCTHELDDSLRRISGETEGSYSNDAEKHTGRLHSELSYNGIDDIMSRGVSQTMDDIQRQLNKVGDAIYRAYMYFEGPEQAKPATEPAQKQTQKQ
ncbi:MAG: hypothetical protein B9S32_12550 [Verrucomicrobia bacterium Tous-C9LFEB]|nr:MAG: hypothetical protein B9S32_12550 [Verrucomicrobia bacterium Tous-C9LFEB]